MILDANAPRPSAATEEKKDLTRAQRKQRRSIAAFRMRLFGASEKSIAARLGVSVRHVRRLLRPFAHRLNYKRHGRVYLVHLAENVTARYHLAENLTDLWELVRERLRTGVRVSYSSWCRIRGEPERVEGKLERSAAWKAFSRASDQLAKRGIQLSRVPSPDGGSAFILVCDVALVEQGFAGRELEDGSWASLKALVDREVGPAAKVLEAYKQRTGNVRRFRGG